MVSGVRVKGDDRTMGGDAAVTEKDRAGPAGASAPRRRRRWRGLRWAAGRGGARGGHFTSAERYDDYTAAYEQAMQDFPEPDATLDVRTDYGVVRMYRFDGAEPDKAPLVLLPGRASGAPMLADNL